MRQPFAAQSFAYAQLDHQIDRALLEHAGSHPLDHIIAAAIFNDDRVDALQMKHLAQQQSGGPRADDADLCAHRCYSFSAIDLACRNCNR